MSAANQLETSGLGSLVVLNSISSSAHIFVKKTPIEIAPALQSPENASLCSLDEYEARFTMPPPSYINEKIQMALVLQGLVPREHFKEKNRPGKIRSIIVPISSAFP